MSLGRVVDSSGHENQQSLDRQFGRVREHGGRLFGPKADAKQTANCTRYHFHHDVGRLPIAVPTCESFMSRISGLPDDILLKIVDMCLVTDIVRLESVRVVFTPLSSRWMNP